jgi:uncharacterized protein with von Willebrand factor type A (vWA) domain
MSDDLIRWRLILGEAGETELGTLSGDPARVDAALDWLYSREPGSPEGAGKQRFGGQGASNLTVPDWIQEVHELFPQEVIERLERDAVEEYGIYDLVTDPRVLESVEPNPALLKAVLQTKHLMNDEVLVMARQLVKKVVEQLMDKLAREVQTRFSGVIQRNRSTPHLRAGPLDMRRTLKANLHRYEPERRKLYVERTYHYLRKQRRLDRWQIIVVVDQSGSMLDSTIHAAVTASILSGLPGIDSHLIAFDTEVVDLTSDVHDPVTTLMSVQLGGGTYIGRAMAYAAGLVKAPSRAIVVLITDFYEGGDPGLLQSVVGELVGQGTKVLGLAALDSASVPSYDRELAATLVKLGAEVGAMTPWELASWLAEKVKA